MSLEYFHRLQELTPTRFWINNVTIDECQKAIAAGAVGCTQNPAYACKMLSDEREKDAVIAEIDRLIEQEENDSDLLVRLQRMLVGKVAEKFMPLYEESGGSQGFVSIQGDPFQEDTHTIVEQALFNRKESSNIMAKVPVTKDGLEAIRLLIRERVPVNATEVMAVRQAIDVCEIYNEETRKIKSPAPLYFSHITGIYDEYLQTTVQAEGIDILPDILWQAGMAIAKKVYNMVKEKNYPVGFIGGGVRGLHHFTEMVGADCAVTINWKGTADKLLEENPYVLNRFFQPVPQFVLEELNSKIKDFRKGYFLDAIKPEEYDEFGPVVLFREKFEVAWKEALNVVATRREAGDSRNV